MKILIAYAGIGGFRKLLGDDHEITAVELDPAIAAIYKSYFPNDNVIIGDAHQYILDHYKEYAGGMIQSSPPCPANSKLVLCRKDRANCKMVYPDFTLYQEVIFLDTFYKGQYAIENVVPYYEPLIKAQKIGRHLWWANFTIKEKEFPRNYNVARATKEDLQNHLGYDLSNFKGIDKRKVLRNCVTPDLGLHVINCAMGKLEKSNEQQFNIFQ